MDRPLDVLFVLDAMLAGVQGFPLVLDSSRVGITGHSFGAWTALEVARRDSRIKVVFPMAPGFRNGATPDFVATLDRPLLIFGGSLDDTCPFESDQRRPYDLANRPKFLIKILGAGHLDFSNLCEVPIAARLVDDGCDPQQIEPEAVHARAKTISVAFLETSLNGCTAYEPFLEPSYVLGLGSLEYWREP
jgi:predicted dienelactone hydrolase